MSLVTLAQLHFDRLPSKIKLWNGILFVFVHVESIEVKLPFQRLEKGTFVELPNLHLLVGKNRYMR